MMQLLTDLYREGMLLVPGAVAWEICGENGENCNSAACRSFCDTIRKQMQQPEPQPSGDTGLAKRLSLAYGLDPGEATAIAAALLAARQGAALRTVVLSADAAARRAVEELQGIIDTELDIHGDLYVIELE